MKALTQHTKRTAALGLSALVLSSVMLCSVACTRDDHKNPGDTTPGGSTAVTTPAQNGGNNGSGSSSDKPMDPNAGTVNPDSDAGNPPAGSDSRDTRSYRDDSFRSRFMH
jgi:hypothetical protein